jgi:ArsR family transcriptional regulator
LDNSIQCSLYHLNMDESQAINALGALAQVQRLRVFRKIVEAGEQGMTPSVIADQLDIGKSRLSFHLKELAHAELVSVEQQGRNLIYRAEFRHMQALMVFLTEHCCDGGQALAVEARRTGDLEKKAR